MHKNTESVDLFQLTKSFMQFSGSNPIIKHQHVALMWYIIETSNSKRWQQEFALYSETAISDRGILKRRYIGDSSVFYLRSEVMAALSEKKGQI